MLPESLKEQVVRKPAPAFGKYPSLPQYLALFPLNCTVSPEDTLIVGAELPVAAVISVHSPSFFL